MPIRWGICSTGKIAETFAAALNSVDESICAAVSSRSLERAESFASKYGFEKAFGSLEEMLSDGNIDIVYIASPMACHYEHAKTAILAGVNVLCEKSVTLNCEQLHELLALAKTKRVFFMEAMWMKCRPSFLKAMEWIKDGGIGNVQMVKADFCNSVTFDENDRLFKPDLGGGCLLDLAVYPFTLAEAVFGGKPDNITSKARMGKTGVDFDMAAILEYESGFAAVTAGFDAQCGNNAAIIGDRGHIELGNWFMCTCDAVLFDENNAVVENFHQDNLCNGYEYEIMEANRCLSAGLPESPLVPHAGTVSVMEMMDECRKQWKIRFPEEM
ncbi:MAG: Gfo/Idh/MocA family oxidoreductase [Oscillospiraceae bacterium]|nr:Gfo/Idh/MocA family oxidoreductase [Oscillospiraceae bacterium]